MSSQNQFPKLHNAMWPGLVGKEPGTDYPPISLEHMPDLTVNASVNGAKFDGVDLFLFHPHTDPDASDDLIKRMADLIAGKGLAVGSLVAPVWPGTVGDSSMGGPDQRARFVLAVKKACRIARILNEHGVRQYGVIRIDAADSPSHWAADPVGNNKKIAETFREAGIIAAFARRTSPPRRGDLLGLVCIPGVTWWRCWKKSGMPGTVGFQADFGAHLPRSARIQRSGTRSLSAGHTEAEFEVAYKQMTDALCPWTIDFHVARNDGSVHGTGSHDKTGRHCRADDPNGKLDIAKCSGYWLEGAAKRGIQHVCWDGCMFSNEILEKPENVEHDFGCDVEGSRKPRTGNA